MFLPLLDFGACGLGPLAASFADGITLNMQNQMKYHLPFFGFEIGWLVTWACLSTEGADGKSQDVNIFPQPWDSVAVWGTLAGPGLNQVWVHVLVVMRITSAIITFVNNFWVLLLCTTNSWRVAFRWEADLAMSSRTAERWHTFMRNRQVRGLAFPNIFRWEIYIQLKKVLDLKDG